MHEPSPTLVPVLDRIRAFMRDEVYPFEAEFLAKPLAELEGVLEMKRKKVKSLGLFSPHMPKSMGGLALTLTDFAHVSEILGTSPVGHYLFNTQAPDIANMEVLLAFGNETQKKRWLEPLARGEIRSCFAMTEPDAPGSNPTWLETRARRDGDWWVITGRKWFTTAADGAAFAICMAVTAPDADSPHARASQIIVPTDTPGFRRIRNLPVMGEPGSGFTSHAEVEFAECRVPYGNLLGAEGAGFAIAQHRLGPGRIHHCMRWIGICERAFALMCERAARRDLSPGKALGTRQIVQEWIADSRAEIHASRLMVLDAAERIEKHGLVEAREVISIIKYYVANVLQRVLDRAIQVHGAMGITDLTPLAYWYRHERGARIYDGPDEVHKTVVARRALRAHGLDVR